MRTGMCSVSYQSWKSASAPGGGSIWENSSPFTTVSFLDGSRPDGSWERPGLARRHAYGPPRRRGVAAPDEADLTLGDDRGDGRQVAQPQRAAPVGGPRAQRGVEHDQVG